MVLDLKAIGRTNKTYGFDGTLRITIEDTYLEDFVAAEVVFLEVGGQAAPFFIEDRWGKGDLFLKLEEVDSKEAARGLTNKTISLRTSDISTKASARADTTVASRDFTSWVGYAVFDQNDLELGPIKEILELPEQFLAVLDYQGKEVMIPLHEHLVLEIDAKHEKVKLEMAEGLLDL